MDKKLNFSPHHAAYREDTTIYSKQLINDSAFDLSSGASPWKSSMSGDLTDLNAKIENAQSNSTIIGDTQAITIVANFSQPGEWIAMQNPNFPAYPEWGAGIDSFGNDSFGLWSNHSWSASSGGLLQAPSINWGRNMSLNFSIADYEITSVNVSAVVNASVIAIGNQDGLEISSGEASSPDRFIVGDYARFYVRVADLQRNNVHEMAYNRTSPDLGKDDPETTLQGDTNMTSVNEDLLKVYLTSALSNDFRNFTIILGLDYWCEINRPSDGDIWNMMRIKSFSLNFTFQKKISYNSYIAWNQTGYQINTTEYKGSGESVDVNILNATLNFNYRLTQAWPITSPNSEIRVYINNYLHSETIKLSNGTIWSQLIKNGTGFDVASLVSLNQNVTIRIQILMLDDFLMVQNCSLLIDNVNLTVFFEATVTTPVPDTQLKLVGSSNIAVPWNDNFTVRANYTVDGSGDPIAGANITIGWIGDYNVTDLGDGTYNITCNTTLTSANQKYTLQIWADAFGNESQYYSAEIQIIGRPTHLHVFLNEQDLTSDPEITLAWNQTVNITGYYTDEGSTENLTGALVELSGEDLNPSAYEYSPQGTGYEFLVNSSYYEVGTHFISLGASLGNYSFASKSIMVKIMARPTALQVFLNKQDLTSDPEIIVAWNQTINITTFYYDTVFENDLLNALVEISGTDLNPGSYAYSPQGTGYEFLVNSSYYEVGTHFISLSASLGNYSFASKIITVKVTARPTFFSIFRGITNVTKASELDVPLTATITLTLNYYDSALNATLDNYEISLQGLDSSDYLITPGTTTSVVIYTTGLELGVYLVSIIAGKDNYTETSHSYQINVNQIPSLLTAEHESITIDPQAQFSIKVTFIIDAARMGTSGTISGATISYYWSRGDGTLTDNGDGTFGLQLEGPLMPGAYKITITAIKDNYEVQTTTIDVIVQSPITEDLMPLIIALTTGLVGFAVVFLAYLLYFRYPAVVRKIRKVRGKMAKGATTKIASHPKKRIFVENLLKEHGANIPPEARTKLKTEYLQLVKEEPLDRKIPEEFSPKTIVVQELEPAKSPPAEKVTPKPAPKSAPKPAPKAFEKPQQVDFGKKPEVKGLPSQKPAKENAKPEGKISLEEQINKIEQEAKKSTKESQNSNNKEQG